jgi:hypothetical protein
MDVKVLLVREAASAVITGPKATLTVGDYPDRLEVTCAVDDLPDTAAEMLRDLASGAEVRLYLDGMCVARQSLRSYHITGGVMTLRAAVLSED